MGAVAVFARCAGVARRESMPATSLPMQLLPSIVLDAGEDVWLRFRDHLNIAVKECFTAGGGKGQEIKGNRAERLCGNLRVGVDQQRERIGLQGRLYTRGH